MFKSTAGRGFSITFENGNTVSVQWGPGNYCDPDHPEGRNAPFDAPMKAAAEGGVWGAKTAEVAAWDSEGNWHNFDHDQVEGWLTPDEVIEFVSFVANNKLRIERPEWNDDAEDDAEDMESL